MSRSTSKASAVVKPSRAPRIATRIYLYTLAGGRCEFNGCNRYLLEHHVTSTPGNFAELAHIYAFSEGGPRGQGNLTQQQLNDLSNLVLLCPTCHKLIDRKKDEYTVDVIRGYKKAHEERVYMLTETAPDRQTTAVVLKANIGRERVDFTLPQMQAAVVPNYINHRDIVEIDFSNIPDQGTDAFWRMATEVIAEKVCERYERSVPNKVTHVSVFALAPIPLLVFLGTCLSDKIPTALFQRHRDCEDWKWKTEGDAINYETRQLRQGKDGTRAALLLSLSGTVSLDLLPREIDHTFSVYEITLAGTDPHPRFLNQAKDLVAFQAVYQQFLRTMTRAHPDLTELKLFPAVPAPVAVACGRDLFPRVDPVLHVYNKEREGYVPAVRVNANDRQ